jgi:hypothetical protein
VIEFKTTLPPPLLPLTLTRLLSFCRFKKESEKAVVVVVVVIVRII